MNGSLFVIINALRLHEGRSRHPGGNFFHVRSLLAELLPILDAAGLTYRVLVDDRGSCDLRGVVPERCMHVISASGVLAQDVAIFLYCRKNPSVLYYRPTGQLPVIPLPCVEIMGVADLNFKSVKMGGLRKFYKEFSYWWSLRRARHVVCISEFTRGEVVEAYGIEGARVSTVHHGASDLSLIDCAEMEVPFPRFWVTFGHQAHKNVDTVLRAMVLDSAGRHKLVVVGKHEYIDHVLKPLASELGVERRVYFAGRVSDQQLAWLYRNSLGLIFVSLYEGFGLPVLEAMTAGCPVIASDRCSIPEVAGDAAYLVPACSETAIFTAMEQLSIDARYREALIERGRRRASGFTWRESAQKTFDIMKSMRGNGA